MAEKLSRIFENFSWTVYGPFVYESSRNFHHRYCHLNGYINGAVNRH